MATSRQEMKLLPGKQTILILILIPVAHLRMRQLLQLYASDSADLISRYYWERIKEQRNLQVFNI